MKKNDNALLISLLTCLCEKPHVGEACKGVGINYLTFFRWVAAGDDVMVEDWPQPGDGPTPFKDCVRIARSMNLVLFDSVLREETLYGVKKILVHEGRIQYQERQEYHNWSDEDFARLGLDPNVRYKCDKDGKFIPAFIYEHVPAALRVRAVALLAGWQESKHLSIDNRVSGGVHVIPYDPAPMAIEVQSEPIDVPSEPMLSIAAPAPIEPEPPAVPPGNVAHDALIAAARAADAAPPAIVEHVEQSAPPAIVEHVEQPHVGQPDDALTNVRREREAIMARLQGKTNDGHGAGPPRESLCGRRSPGRHRAGKPA